jgi:hypothetical protein
LNSLSHTVAAESRRPSPSYFALARSSVEVTQTVNCRLAHSPLRQRSIDRIMFTEVYALPRRKNPPVGPDRLLAQLDKVEQQLQQWISLSPKNADLFRRDPFGAMHAAGLNLEGDLMLELELITKTIAKKLK